MALHDPILNVPFIDKATGLVSEPWAKWLLINKRDKMNRVEDAQASDIPTLTAEGHLDDSLKLMGAPFSYLIVTDNGDGTLSLEVNDSMPYLFLGEITATKGSASLTVNVTETVTYRIYSR